MNNDVWGQGPPLAQWVFDIYDNTTQIWAVAQRRLIFYIRMQQWQC